MALKKILICFCVYILIGVIEKVFISYYDSSQIFTDEELIAFYEKIPSSKRGYNSRIVCEEYTKFFWYQSKICSEYIADSPGCKSPNIDISYSGLKPKFFPEIVATRDRDHILGRSLARISADSKICRNFTKLEQ